MGELGDHIIALYPVPVNPEIQGEAVAAFLVLYASGRVRRAFYEDAGPSLSYIDLEQIDEHGGAA